MTRLYTVNLNLSFPISDELKSKSVEWCNKLYSEDLKNIPRWTDIPLDESLNVSIEPTLVAKRFGHTKEDGWENGFNQASSFWCIVGSGLNSYTPWFKPMEQFFNSEGLTFSLTEPCILMANGYVRKHPDVFDNTVMNYDILGSENMIWYVSHEDPNSYDVDQDIIPGTETYDETYEYDPHTSILLNCTRLHGGFLKDGFEPSPRAVLHHIFNEEYDVVAAKIAEMQSNGKLAELQLLINESVG